MVCDPTHDYVKTYPPLNAPERTNPVYYFSRMLPAYRVPVLDRLNERLGGRLVVCHGQRPAGNPTLMGEVDADFRRVVLRNIWLGGETVHAQPFGGVFEQYGTPAAVIAEESPRSITLPFLLRSARRLGAARILWGIFYSVHRPYSSRHPLQQYRLRMARRVEACLCYSRRSRDVLATHVDSDRLFVAQNTLDTTTLFALQEQLAEEGRTEVRKRLGLLDRPTFAFVGQLVERKGTYDLISFIESIVETRDATLLVIGDGPERSAMEERVIASRLEDHVRFLGSIPDADKSAPYIFAADVMVIPGYVGLVINHAFSFGVPILTQEPPDETPFHGPEIESLVPDKNGMMVPREPGALVEGALRMIEDQPRFSRNALEYSRQHLTVDHLVDAIANALSFARPDGSLD